MQTHTHTQRKGERVRERLINGSILLEFTVKCLCMIESMMRFHMYAKQFKNEISHSMPKHFSPSLEVIIIIIIIENRGTQFPRHKIARINVRMKIHEMCVRNEVMLTSVSFYSHLLA